MLQCFSDQFRRMPFYERRVIGACSIDALNLSASLVGQIQGRYACFEQTSSCGAVRAASEPVAQTGGTTPKINSHFSSSLEIAQVVQHAPICLSEATFATTERVFWAVAYNALLDLLDLAGEVGRGSLLSCFLPRTPPRFGLYYKLFFKELTPHFPLYMCACGQFLRRVWPRGITSCLVWPHHT